MKKFGIILFLLALGFTSCKEDDKLNNSLDYGECIACSKVATLSRTEGQSYLAEEYASIQTDATSTPCTDASKWVIIPIGSKACGGPTGFIAFSTSIDEVKFLKRVEDYTKAQTLFNKKWGVVSTCDLPIKPTNVACVDGKPKLIN